MGGIESRAQMITRFNKINPQKWDIVRTEGLTEIAVDSKGREGQVNVIKLDPTKTPEKELEVYYYRRTVDAPLVKCYGAEPMKSTGGGLCGVNNTMKVITERIIKRWGELPQLTFSEILYALREALDGYSALFKEVGAFEVNQNMLGLNNQGDLHVWLNENFADNNPSLEKGILYTTSTNDHLKGVGTEGEMIRNILQLIEEKCETGKYPQDFSQQIYSRNTKFQDTIDALDSYIEKRNILIPTKIHPDNSKMYVSKVKKIQVLSGSRATKEFDGKARQQSIAASPQRTEFKSNFIASSPGIENRKSEHVTFGNQNVYQTVYVKNDGKQEPVMTPRHATFGTPKGKFSSEIPSASFGYQTGPTVSFENQRYTDLRLNPNIDATESIYEPKQKTPVSSYLYSNEVSGYKASGLQKSPEPAQRTTFDIVKPTVSFGSGQKTGQFTDGTAQGYTYSSNLTNLGFTTSGNTGNTGNIYTPSSLFANDGKMNVTKTEIISPPAPTVISSSPNKAAIKFNYTSDPATTKVTQNYADFISPVTQAQTGKTQKVEKKEVMETSQVTKQY